LAKLRKLNKSTVHIKRAFISQFGFFFKDKLTAIWTAIIVALLSIVAGWIPDGLSEILSAVFFDGNFKKGLTLFGSGAFILLILTCLALRYSEEGKFEVFEDAPEKKRILIPFLSAVAPRGELKDSQTLVEEIKKIPEGKSLKEKFDIVQNNPSLRSWRMPLEAIKYHQPKLKKIVVITSPESSKQLTAFKELVRKFFGKEIAKAIEEKQVSSFENIKELFNVLNEVYAELEKEGYRSKDAIIDVTGGQKINSIAGAFMTSFYNNREFQYISTNTFEVKSYDVRLITND